MRLGSRIEAVNTMNKEHLIAIMESGEVMRFHACPRMSKQLISSHQWGVAVLCRYFKPDITADELMTALTHDANELVTGDIPATFKWSYPEVKRIIDDVEKKISFVPDFLCNENFRTILKISDFMEGIIFCHNSYMSGNLEAQVIYDRWRQALENFMQLHNIPEDITIKVIALLGHYDCRRAK